MESKEWNLRSGIQGVESREWNLSSGIREVESREWNLRSGIWNPKTSRISSHGAKYYIDSYQ